MICHRHDGHRHRAELLRYHGYIMVFYFTLLLLRYKTNEGGGFGGV